MKKIFLFATAMTALLATSCSNEDNANIEDNSGKTRIALSAGDNGEIAKTRAGFTNQTRIVARIVSENRSSGTSKSVKTVLIASAEENEGTFSRVSYAENKTRYWDDAFGRSSILSVYAVAIPNKNDGTAESNLKETVLKGGDTWAADATPDNTLTWTLKTTQAYADLADEDLTYSNNIQEGNVGGNSVYTWDYTKNGYPEENPNNAIKHGTDPNFDGRLYFTQSADYKATLTEASGHFDKGQMEFRHALTRIQVNTLKGEGYTGDLTTTSIVLKNQPYKGTFNIKNAVWTDPTNADVTMAKWSSPASEKNETYEAQVLPGYTFADDAANAIIVTVGVNKYYITNAMLRKSLEGKVDDDYVSKIGTRYIFDVTIGKAGIVNITATIIDWSNITAENTSIDNSHYKFTFYKAGSNVTSDVNLYKYEQTLNNLATGGDYSAPAVAAKSEDPAVTYSEVAGFSLVDGQTYFTTSEYFKDNQTAYHFRAINNAAKGTLNSEEGKVTFTMTSGSTDYLWGAPMKPGLNSSKLDYDPTNGYLASIEKGIVAADTHEEANYINLTQIYMMSKLQIKLTSIPSAQQTNDAKVNLVGATVQLTKLSETGTVNLGSGVVTPTGDPSNHAAITVSKEGDTDVYSCELNVIPQLLKRGDNDDDYVGITIHTADNNEYYIIKKLSDIIATSVGTQITNMQTKDAAITRWYPGHKYIYTFNITKTEIKNITATIVGWNEVVAGNTNLDLEK